MGQSQRRVGRARRYWAESGVFPSPCAISNIGCDAGGKAGTVKSYPANPAAGVSRNALRPRHSAGRSHRLRVVRLANNEIVMKEMERRGPAVIGFNPGGTLRLDALAASARVGSPQCFAALWALGLFWTTPHFELPRLRSRAKEASGRSGT
jgi:hypothetical protein